MSVKSWDVRTEAGTRLSTSRYIEVYAPDGSYVSRHSSFRECSQAAFQHALSTKAGGNYRCVYPEEVITIELAAEEPVPDPVPEVQMDSFDARVDVVVV